MIGCGQLSALPGSNKRVPCGTDVNGRVFLCSNCHVSESLAEAQSYSFSPEALYARARPALNIVGELLETVSDERLQLIAKQFGFTVSEVRSMSEADPSNGKYLTWITKLVKEGSLRFPEDVDKVKQRLTQFMSLSRKPRFTGHRDINKYQSYGELAKTIEANSEVKTKGEVKRSAEMEGCKKLSEDGTYTLYEVTTPEAAAKLFRNTEWCVKDPKWFNEYKPKRFYYVEKNGQPYVLLHPESGQMMDVDDEQYEGERIRMIEPYVLIAKNAKVAQNYAEHIIKGRWPEAEPVIMKDAELACRYSVNVIQGRWPEAEPVIMKDPMRAYWYAVYLIKERWPEAESVIMKSPLWASEYAKHIIKGRWPEAEPVIIKDPASACTYAIHVIKGRWPEAEPVIKQDRFYATAYRKSLRPRTGSLFRS